MIYTDIFCPLRTAQAQSQLASVSRDLERISRESAASQQTQSDEGGK